MYESQYPGVQDAPLAFWGNDFGGSMRRPVLTDYTIVGYMNGQLWLQSKTGDASDSIQINFHVDPRSFEHHMMNKKASFAGSLEWDYRAHGHYFEWTCTKIDY